MFVGLLWFVFIVSALLLALIILIQEGKGGGLGEAFGGMGAETFGVKASGVNKTTGTLALVWVLSAIFINKCTHTGSSSGLFDNSAEESTDTGGGAGAAPGDGGGDGEGPANPPKED